MDDKVPPLPAERCGVCRWFRRDPANFQLGLCRGGPPTTALAPDRRGLVVAVGHGFPPVPAAMEACGAFRPAKQLFGIAGGSNDA